MRRTDIRAGEYTHGHGRRDDLTIDPAMPAESPADDAASGRDGRDNRGDAGRADTGPGEVRPGGSGPGDAAGAATSLGDSAGHGNRSGPDAMGGPGGATGAAGEDAGGGSEEAARLGEIVPGPPGGVLDLAALAAVEARLRELAAAGIDHAVSTGARGPRGAAADRAMCEAASTIAAALWFDTLRVADRVSATPHAGPLLGAVHQVLRSALDGDEPPMPGGPPLAAAFPVAAGLPVAAGPRPPDRLPSLDRVDGAAAAGPSTRRPPRATGAGNVGPNGTIWSALASRFAGERFDRAPSGRQICLIDFAELRDSAVWEAVTDERVSHLGELFWVVLVTGGAPTDSGAPGTPAGPGPGGPPGGVGGPARAARMFEAAGWQVLTLRYGRRLAALFRAPGGAALRARLDAMSPAEYLALLQLDGTELRRRLAGPGASGAGVDRLLDGLSDEQIHDALRDLGGHDLALIIDAFDEVEAGRPTVLFAYTGPLPAPARPAAPPTAPAPPPTAPPPTTAPLPGALLPGAPSAALVPAGPRPGAGAPGRPSAALPVALPAGRLARHVAAYLDRAPQSLGAAPAVPVDAGRPPTGWWSTQEAFGATLRDLPSLAPEAAAAVVTISTRDADRVLTGWIEAARGGAARGGAEPVRGAPVLGRPAGARPAEPAGPARSPEPAGLPGSAGPAGPAGQPGPAGPGPEGARSGGGRHVAGGLSAGAFGGVLASLGVAWSRLGLPLLPIGVSDEMSVTRVLPGWASGGAADGRSLLTVADTGVDPVRPGGWRHGAIGVPGIACWEPAFAQDLVWCLLEALRRLGRVDGASSLIRLSARPVDQRLAGLPGDAAGWWRRRAAVLAGGYRLRPGEPSAPLTLVGMGAVMPEVLRAADELSSGLRREIGVVCVTSPDLLFDALQARRGLADGDDAVLGELFPPNRRGPLLTVVDGDARTLGFLAGVHGEHVTTLGSAAPIPTAPGQTAQVPSAPADPRSPCGPAAGGAGAPVDTATIVGAALDLIDEAAAY
ncbi:pyruvate dehydrogenase E1 component [Frankia sp. Hr75.2]|nr:pyruvate dehydrogenase E1 component [Frankia sp. Hr75.2]